MADTPISGSASLGSGGTSTKKSLFRILLSRPAIVVYALLLLLIGVSVLAVVIPKQQSKGQVKNGIISFDSQDIPLDTAVQSGDLQIDTQQNLSVNGQLRANNTLVLTPTGQPSSTTLGQLYLDSTTNKINYYNGDQFVQLVDGTEIQDFASESDLSGLTNQVNSLQNQVSQLTVPSDIARLGVANTFTGSNVFSGGLAANSLTVTGATTLGSTTISSLLLSNPLSVSSGGTGQSSLTPNGILLGNGTSPISSVTSAASGYCLISTASAPSFQPCPGGAGGVDSIDGLTGAVTIANTTAAGSTITINNASTTSKGIAQFNASNFSVASGVVNTIQNISVSSAPTFAGITLNGNFTLGTNSITTGGGTITSSELDVLDGGIDESEVAGVITDVTTGSGLSGGAASGNATLNIASANGGITVNPDNIALTLQPTGDALSATTSSGSGLEILAGGVTLLQGCADAQILKWNEATDTWGCAADAGGSGVGDDVLVDGANALGANIVSLAASGTSAGTTWNLNTATDPDEITLIISNASATQAGAVTTGVQTFAGDKTFNNAATIEGLFTANGNIALQTGNTLTINGDAFTDLTGTGLIVSGGALQTTLGTSIESGEITDGTIATIDLADGAINSAKILDGAIATADIGDGQVTSGKIADGTVASIDIADGTIVGVDIANDTIALGTKTTGNYVATINDGAGLTVTGAGSEGSTPTLNIVSANGGIIVNPDNIALTLQSSGDALSATTSSGSGLEILAGGISLLQGCSDAQILKWNEATDTWGCAADAGGSGVGDDVLVNGINATGANIINLAATGTSAGTSWSLNTVTDPDEVSLVISNASATQAGAVTTGAQTFAGDKTFNNAVTTEGLFTANGGLTLQAGDTLTVNSDAFTDLTGTGLIVSGGALQTTLGTSIESSEITDGTIATVDLADGAINSAKILDGAIATADIGDGQVTSGKIADGTIATIDIADGQITSAKITDGTIIGTDIANDSIDLGTKTNGDYQSGTTAGTGIAVTGSGGEGSTPTISLDYSSTLSSNSLGVNQSSFAATGILFEGATADGFETLLTLADPTADNTITLPNASGEVCLTSGNCSGVGGGVTTSGGTVNTLAKFTAAQGIGDSSITDDGTTVSTTGNLVVQGGNITAGTGSQLGSFILHDGNGQTTTLRAGDSAGNLSFILPTAAGSQYQCLKYDTAGQLIWDDCDGGGGGGSGVLSLNGLSGSLAIQGNAQIGVSASSPNINLSLNADSIGDAQLAFNTGQHLTTTSTPTFGGLNLGGNLNIGTNSIVTGGATISSTELDVLDAGIDESEVSGVITDVTAGNGLTGGATAGNATLNIASANGAIAVNPDNIALMLQSSGDALSATTSSGSGLEILSGGLTLLQGCSDSQILKWNETTDTWGCAADAGGSGVGDDIFVNGLNADGGNFIDTVASGTDASVTWNLNTASSPDDISISIGNASATEAGTVSTGTQVFGGDKTFNNALTVAGLFTANGGVTIQTGDTFTMNGDAFTDLTGTGLTISGGSLQTTLGTTIDSVEIVDGTITGTDIADDSIALGTKTTGDYVAGVNGGAGLTVSGSGGEGSTPTLDIASANSGITVNADNIALTLQPTGDALSATTSSGSGLELTAGGITLLQGCGDAQILKWNEATDTWGCAADAGGSGVGDDVAVNGSNADGANFINTAATGTSAGITWNLNTVTSPDEITLTVSNASATQAGVVTTSAQGFSGIKTFNDGIATPVIRPLADSTTALNIQNAAGSSNILTVDTTNGRIGIGTTPSYKLHVADTITASSGTNANTGSYFTLNVNPSSAPTGTTTYYGSQTLNTSSSANLNANVTLYGNVATVQNTGGATLGAAVGTGAIAQNAGTGTITNALAGRFKVSNIGSGSITNGVALQAGTPEVTAGSIGTAYGLLIDPQDVAGVGTGYGIWQAGADDLNVFAGKVGIGVIPSTHALEVSGGASIQGNTSIATTAGNTLNLGNSTGALTVTGNSSSTFNLNGVNVSASEFNVLDGGIDESEVTGVITDVTAGNGLSGGAASGNATLAIVSANAGITINPDDIALTLQPAGDALSATTSSGSGLEITAGGLSLLQGCSDSNVLKWNETTDTWGCATDAGGSGVGDDVLVNGVNTDGANFINTIASGTAAGISWNLNAAASPDEISLSVSNASNTQAGVVTTGAQTFAGNKTFTGTMLVDNTNSAAFRVQASGGAALLTADTSANQVLLGSAGSLAGKLVVNNATNTNAITIQSGVTASNWTLTLPTNAGLAGQCLKTDGTGVTSWGACGTSGQARKITLTAEYAGTILDTASDTLGTVNGTNGATVNCNTNSSGTVISGLDGASRMNYYRWMSTQATTQCYDVVVQVPIPSDWGSWAANPIDVQAKTANATDTAMAIQVLDTTNTADTNYNYASTTLTTGWTDVATTGFASSNYSAGNYLTIKIRMSSRNSQPVYVGNIVLNYITN